MATELMADPSAMGSENIDAGRDILAELVAERDCLEAAFVHSKRLICEEIEKVRKAQGESIMDAQGNVHVTEKVVINLDDNKQHNLIGRLLGPKGLTLKRMQVEANAKMSILGKGSTRDKKKEDELRESDNPNYAHLKEDLHVLVEVVAPSDQARARLAAGVAEVKKMLVPPVPGAGDPIGDRYRDQDPVLYDQFVNARGYPPQLPPSPGMGRGGMGRGGMRSPGGGPPPPRGGRGGRMLPPRRGGGGRGGNIGRGPGRGGRGRGGPRPQVQNSSTGYGDNFANDSNFSSFSDNTSGGYGNTGGGGAGGYGGGGTAGYGGGGTAGYGGGNNLSYGGGGRGGGGGPWKASHPRDSGGYRHHPYQY